MENKAQAYIRFVRISDKKLRLYSYDIMRYSPVIAAEKLALVPSRCAKILKKAIESAINNAVRKFGVDSSQLKFSSIIIEKGPFLKRFRPGSRGVAKPYKRKSSHIKVIVTTVKENEQKKVKSEKEKFNIKNKDKNSKITIKKDTKKKIISKNKKIKNNGTESSS